MAPGTDIIAITMTELSRFGKISLNNILTVLVPRVLDARICSLAFNLSVFALTSRLMPIHPDITIAIIMEVSPGLKITTRRDTTTRLGIPLMISVIRIMTISTLPP